MNVILGYRSSLSVVLGHWNIYSRPLNNSQRIWTFDSHCNLDAYDSGWFDSNVKIGNSKWNLHQWHFNKWTCIAHDKKPIESNFTRLCVVQCTIPCSKCWKTHWENFPMLYFLSSPYTLCWYQYYNLLLNFRWQMTTYFVQRALSYGLSYVNYLSRFCGFW